MSEKHTGYYSSLLLILFLGVFLFVQLTGQKQMQQLVIGFIALSYVLWGILHHSLHHDLRLKIVVEYVLMGLLGLSLVYFFIQ